MKNYQLFRSVPHDLLHMTVNLSFGRRLLWYTFSDLGRRDYFLGCHSWDVLSNTPHPIKVHSSPEGRTMVRNLDLYGPTLVKESRHCQPVVETPWKSFETKRHSESFNRAWLNMIYWLIYYSRAGCRKIKITGGTGSMYKLASISFWGTCEWQLSRFSSSICKISCWKDFCIILLISYFGSTCQVLDLDALNRPLLSYCGLLYFITTHPKQRSSWWLLLFIGSWRS